MGVTHESLQLLASSNIPDDDRPIDGGAEDLGGVRRPSDITDILRMASQPLGHAPDLFVERWIVTDSEAPFATLVGDGTKDGGVFVAVGLTGVLGPDEHHAIVACRGEKLASRGESYDVHRALVHR